MNIVADLVPAAGPDHGVIAVRGQGRATGAAHAPDLALTAVVVTIPAHVVASVDVWSGRGPGAFSYLLLLHMFILLSTVLVLTVGVAVWLVRGL